MAHIKTEKSGLNPHSNEKARVGILFSEQIRNIAGTRFDSSVSNSLLDLLEDYYQYMQQFGMVSQIEIVSSDSGFDADSSPSSFTTDLAVTGGSGEDLTVNIIVDRDSSPKDRITGVTVNNPGRNYNINDIVELTQSTSGKIATFRILNLSSGPSDLTNRISSSHDLDDTSERFLFQFQQELAKELPSSIKISKKELYSKIQKFYDMRGSEESIRAFFQIFFGVDVGVSYPKYLLFKPSEGNNTISITNHNVDVDREKLFDQSRANLPNGGGFTAIPLPQRNVDGSDNLIFIDDTSALGKPDLTISNTVVDTKNTKLYVSASFPTTNSAQPTLFAVEEYDEPPGPDEPYVYDGEYNGKPQWSVIRLEDGETFGSTDATRNDPLGARADTNLSVLSGGTYMALYDAKWTFRYISDTNQWEWIRIRYNKDTGTEIEDPNVSNAYSFSGGGSGQSRGFCRSIPQKTNAASDFPPVGLGDWEIANLNDESFRGSAISFGDGFEGPDGAFYPYYLHNNHGITSNINVDSNYLNGVYQLNSPSGDQYQKSSTDLKVKKVSGRYRLGDYGKDWRSIETITIKGLFKPGILDVIYRNNYPNTQTDNLFNYSGETFTKVSDYGNRFTHPGAYAGTSYGDINGAGTAWIYNGGIADAGVPVWRSGLKKIYLSPGPDSDLRVPLGDGSGTITTTPADKSHLYYVLYFVPMVSGYQTNLTCALKKQV